MLLHRNNKLSQQRSVVAFFFNYFRFAAPIARLFVGTPKYFWNDGISAAQAVLTRRPFSALRFPERISLGFWLLDISVGGKLSLFSFTTTVEIVEEFLPNRPTVADAEKRAEFPSP